MTEGINQHDWRDFNDIRIKMNVVQLTAAMEILKADYLQRIDWIKKNQMPDIVCSQCGKEVNGVICKCKLCGAESELEYCDSCYQVMKE